VTDGEGTPAARRRSWPTRVIRPGDESPSDDLSSTTTPAERLAMMWELVEQTWSLAGRSIPGYSRREMVARVVRPGDTDER
jgi:hypothetical protein